MNNYDEHEEMIPDFLAGKLDDQTRLGFEARLAADQKLQDAVTEYRRLAQGLAVIDSINRGHIDTHKLISFADEPNALSPGERTEIEHHLSSCADCREELNLCRPPVTEPASQKSAFAQALAWLFSPRPALRPIHVIALICILVIPQAYYFASNDPTTQAASPFRLESTSRDLEPANDFIINPDQTLVLLEFVVPVIDDRVYDFELFDSEGNLIFAKPSNQPENILAVEIPTTYLQDGRYQLRVIELDANQNPTETFEYEFKVRLQKR